jgi:hypothetical protein
MADQCIVCLEDLDTANPETDLIGAESCLVADNVAATASEADPSEVPNDQHIAVIKTCGHILHDQCLQEWTQKANSCPICRQAFNLVDVYDKIGGK